MVVVGWLLLVLVVAFMAFDDYVLQRTARQPLTPLAVMADALIPREEATESAALPNSIAVLPFESLSPDPSNDFFAASLHEEILSQLGIIRGLRPIARTSVLQYAGAARPITEIAHELNAESVMEGSVAYGEGRVVVSVRLIDAATGTRLWGDRYNNMFEDVFEIQEDIARNVVAALEAEFLPGEQQRIGQRRTESPAADTLYLEARSLASDPVTAEELLERAIGIDPEFALAHGHKAYLYASALRGTGRFARNGLNLVTLARDAANRALEIDPSLGIAHMALGNTHFVSGELAQAQAEYERALELSPNDSLVLALYSAFKRYIGEYDEAIGFSERGASIDPSNAFVLPQLGFNHWYARDYDAAIAAFVRTIALAPTDEGAHLGLAAAEIAKGNEDTALRELQFAAELLDPDFTALRLEQLTFAYSQLGREQEASRFHGMLMELAEQESVPEAMLGMADLAIGEHERAFERLENAVRSPSIGDQIVLGDLKANPYGVPMLEESPWRELRSRIGVL